MAVLADVIVVGGGFAGILLAYNLSKAGAKVILLEAGLLGCGSSGACAGRAQIIESETENYLELVLAGFRRLPDLGMELDVDLEWELPGHLTLIDAAEDWAVYQAQVARLRSRDIPAEFLDPQTLKQYEPALSTHRMVAVYSQEGHLNPFKFLLGFANAARRLGAKILVYTPVIGFEVEGQKVVSVLSARDQFTAGVVALAGGAWTGKLARQVGGYLPIRYTHAEAMVTEPLPRIIHHHIGMAGFYETVHGGKVTVTLGVGQHPNGTLVVSNAIQQSRDIDQVSTFWGMPALSNALQKCFPTLALARVVRTWAAPSPFLPDYLPAVGWLPGFDNLFVLVGLHLTIPTIPILAEQSAEMILGQQNISFLAPFSPDRFVPGGSHGTGV